MLKDWPAVAAYSVTRSQPDASVAVESQRGDPLIAFRRSGQGRVVVVTSGLGRWTPQWLPWRSGRGLPVVLRIGSAAHPRMECGVGGVGSACRAADRGRCPGRDGLARYRQRVHRGEDADRAGSASHHGLHCPRPVARDAARHRLRPLHVRGINVARYAATTAPPAQPCGEREMGHEPGTARVEK